MKVEMFVHPTSIRHTCPHSSKVTADNAILSWQAWRQVNVCAIHAAQALLLDGAPVAKIRAMNSLSRTLWRSSQDWFQFQIHYLTTEMQNTRDKKS